MPDILAPAEKYQTRDLGAKVQVVTGTGVLLGVQVCNNQAAAVFIQLFDALSANVTLATTNPDWEFSVPASTSTKRCRAGVDRSTGVWNGHSGAE